MTDLQEIRKQIDEVDEQIVRLFERRMKLTKEVAESPRENRYSTRKENERSWRHWERKRRILLIASVSGRCSAS